jgi:RNA polymerase sigma factor (TIGR02999 family)
MNTPDPDITELIIEARNNSPDAVARLFPLVYEELRRMAHRALLRERTGHTLSTTALVHEAYLKMVDQNRAAWNDRAHFMAISATAMRRILVDYARRQKRLKRDGDRRPITLDDAMFLADQGADELIALDDALAGLSELSDRLRFGSGTWR